MTRLISIEGNIGSGKSTFVRNLQLYYSTSKNCNNKKICFLQEPVDMWNTITDETGKNVIECFYADNKKYAFAFQMMAYISRLATIKETIKNNYDIIFMERCLFTDRNVFAKMLYDDDKINEIEYKIYNEWFNEFINDFPKIEYVYIKTDPEVAFSRIIKRGRHGEIIPLEYLTKCNDYHNNWLNTVEPIYIINGNTDTSESDDIIYEWINNVNEWVFNNIEDINNYTINNQELSEYILTFDGASRGNPGLCGIGYVIWKNSDIVFQDKDFVNENNTNNYAEYMALIKGLEKCIELNINTINIQGDSNLVIKQITNEYKTLSLNLIPLYNSVIKLFKCININSCKHISRNQNSYADKLANDAINEYHANGIGVWQQ